MYKRPREINAYISLSSQAQDQKNILNYLLNKSSAIHKEVEGDLSKSIRNLENYARLTDLGSAAGDISPKVSLQILSFKAHSYVIWRLSGN